MVSGRVGKKKEVWPRTWVLETQLAPLGEVSKVPLMISGTSRLPGLGLSDSRLIGDKIGSGI